MNFIKLIYLLFIFIIVNFDNYYKIIIIKTKFIFLNINYNLNF